MGMLRVRFDAGDKSPAQIYRVYRYLLRLAKTRGNSWVGPVDQRGNRITFAFDGGYSADELKASLTRMCEEGMGWRVNLYVDDREPAKPKPVASVTSISSNEKPRPSLLSAVSK